jgi:hypothetical protein
VELVFKQAKIDTKEERERVKGLEQKVVIAYKNIPKTAQMTELMAMEKIDQIV